MIDKALEADGPIDSYTLYAARPDGAQVLVAEVRNHQLTVAEGQEATFEVLTGPEARVKAATTEQVNELIDDAFVGRALQMVKASDRPYLQDVLGTYRGRTLQDAVDDHALKTGINP